MEHSKENSETEGIVLIDKPSGITSFDVIRKLRKESGAKPKTDAWRMGHAGTLDPLATGLLIVASGKETKKLKEYIKLPKTYEAEILLGTETDTGDIDGTVVAKRDVPHFSEKTIADAVNAMIGARTVPVPVYSAVKVGGKKLYEYARAGEESSIEIPRKTMEVTGITLNKISRDNGVIVLTVTMDVSSGTYVRTIAGEIGKELGVPATVTKLRRTRIGPFDVKSARKIQ